jgi:hypothetical protein
MNMERAALRSEIALREKRQRDIKVEASGLQILLREHVGAWVSVSAMDPESIRLHANRLADLVEESKRLAGELENLQESLNG